jgi:hypothetical protein
MDLWTWSNDYYGNREDGAEAAMRAEGEQYKIGFGLAVGFLVSQPDFVELVSTDVTDLIGLPGGSPGHRSGLVAALTPVCARAYGLVASGHRRSTDPRHKHVLTVWAASPYREFKPGVEVNLE